MPSRLRAGAAAVLCALLAVALVTAVPAIAQDEADLARTRAELSATRGRIDATSADLSSVRDRIALIEEDLELAERYLASVETEIETTQEEVQRLTLESLQLQEAVGAARERIQDKARAIYTTGPDAPFMELFETTTADEAMDRATVIGRLADTDRSVAEEAAADRARLDVVTEELAGREELLAGLRRDADQQRAAIDANLDEAEELRAGLQDRIDGLEGDESELSSEITRIQNAIAERKRREEEARRRAEREAAAQAAAADAAREAAEQEAAAQPQPSRSSSPSNSSSPSTSNNSSDSSTGITGGLACPMSGLRLYNDWGAPRGGGTRSHEGNDLVGSKGQSVYAITSGIWDIYPYGNSAGLWAILKGDDGHSYWYLHLNSHSVGDGARVSTGQRVATNGNTGNAAGGVSHIHFEYHPGGGGPVDPYPLLSRAC